MALNDLFNQINSLLSTVQSLVNQTRGIAEGPVQDKIHLVNSLITAIRYRIAQYYTRNEKELFNLSLAMHASLVSLFNQTADAIGNNINKIVPAIRDYYSQITRKLEQAIQETYNEIAGIEVYMEGYTDAAVNSVRNDLIDEIIATEAEMAGQIALVEANVTTSLADMEIAVGEVETSLLETITTTASGIYDTVNAWVDNLWSALGGFMDWVEDEFLAYYNIVRAWLDNMATEIYTALTNTFNDLKLWAERELRDLMQWVVEMKMYLEGLLDKSINTLTSWVQEGIKMVEDSVTALTEVTTWRFDFLNVSLAYPELSFLQVLTRPDELFERYKPYWQALFVRIMKEA